MAGTAALGQDVAEARRIYRRAASSTSWRSGSARFSFSLPCTSISFRARSGVSSRRVRLAHRRSAKAASPSAVLDRCCLYRPRRGIDPLPCRRLDRERPIAPWQNLSAPSCWRWVMALVSSASPISRAEAAAVGRAAGTMAFTNYSRIRHLWLDLLRLWSRPVRPPRRRQRTRLRRRRLHWPGLVQCLGLRRYRYGPVEWLWRTLMYGAGSRCGNGVARLRSVHRAIGADVPSRDRMSAAHAGRRLRRHLRREPRSLRRIGLVIVGRKVDGMAREIRSSAPACPPDCVAPE